MGEIDGVMIRRLNALEKQVVKLEQMNAINAAILEGMSLALSFCQVTDKRQVAGNQEASAYLAKYRAVMLGGKS